MKMHLRAIGSRKGNNGFIMYFAKYLCHIKSNKFAEFTLFEKEVTCKFCLRKMYKI